MSNTPRRSPAPPLRSSAGQRRGDPGKAPPAPLQIETPEFVLDDSGLRAIANAEAIAVPVLATDDGPELGPGAAELAEVLDVDLLDVLAAERATGAVGELTLLPVPSGVPGIAALRRILLVGVGRGQPDDVRRAGAVVGRAVMGRDLLVTTVPGVLAGGLEPFVAGLTLGSFRFSWRSDDVDGPVRRVVIADGGGTQAELDRAVALAEAGWRARTLATVPSNLKNPAWLAGQAEQLAADAGLEVRVWDEQQLADEGFGGIVSVGRASATPPRLIRLDYQPSARKAPTLALIGKGITFDTGGLNIKPGQSMVSMKRDMTGGAVVMATMAALAAVDCPVRVVGLVAAAENAISGAALRPGDVIRHYGGRTTEVANTDAEGRLVLADALAYAVEEVKPDAIVDVATLTGGIKVALGQQLGGLFATDDGLADSLMAAGARAGEPLWRFPLYSGYESALSSPLADATNHPKGPAAIMAALFLKHFVGDVPWVHLDIASVGDVPEDRYEWTEGPSGFGARALLTWLGTEQPLGANLKKPGGGRRSRGPAKGGVGAA